MQITHKKLDFVSFMLVTGLAVMLMSTPTSADERQIDISDEEFHAVNFNGNANIFLSQGSKASLSVRGSEDALDELSVDIRRGVLVIKSESGFNFFSQYKSEEIEIELVVVSLDELVLKGSADVKAVNLDLKSLSLDVSGAGDLIFKDLYAESLVINAKGASEFQMEGEVETQDISLKGASDYEALELISETATIMVAGSGDASIQVEESLDVRIYGVGEVSYLGTPQVTQKVRGVGSVKRLNI